LNRETPTRRGDVLSVSESGSRVGQSVQLSSQCPRAESVWLSLAISFVVGLLYTIILMGPTPLNPRNIDWITPDAADHYIVWELFRQDPQWHWPLTYTNRVGYPVGESIALVDPNPLLVVLLKPLSALLPEPFQYFGLEAVLCCSLQFFFALRLLARLQGNNRLGRFLGAFFFLLALPLGFRLIGHYALCNQWLILAALLIYLRAQDHRAFAVRRFFLSSLLLAAAAVAINPYIAFQVLFVLSVTAASLLWQGRLTLPAAIGFMSLLAAASGTVTYSLGFFIPGGHGYSASGYRVYSMNLLGPLDSYGRSVLFRFFPGHAVGQYEGYCYLGAGIIYLLAIILLVLIWRRKMPSLPRSSVIPLLLCCAVLILMALSTKITFGARTLVDLDPHERLSPVLGILRASGRMFWTPYYVLLTAVVSLPFLLWRKSTANLVLAIVMLFQVVDIYPTLKSIRGELSNAHPSPLRSPIWSTLGTNHQNLVILPAWQCDNVATPGGLDGYRIFGILATQQKMRINSYYPARYIQSSQDFHCGKAIAALGIHPLSPDSAYVVTPFLASMIANGPTGPGKCHDLDGFILCSVKSDFELAATLKNEGERLYDSVRDSGFEDEDLALWQPFQNVAASVSTSQAHGGAHSLSESAGEGSVWQDVSGLEPGHVYVISAWVSASQGATATAQIGLYSDSANLATFSPEVHVTPEWQQMTHSMAASASGSLRLHLFRKNGSGTIYWDDLSIYREN